MMPPRTRHLSAARWLCALFFGTAVACADSDKLVPTGTAGTSGGAGTGGAAAGTAGTGSAGTGGVGGIAGTGGSSSTGTGGGGGAAAGGGEAAGSGGAGTGGGTAGSGGETGGRGGSAMGRGGATGRGGSTSGAGGSAGGPTAGTGGGAGGRGGGMGSAGTTGAGGSGDASCPGGMYTGTAPQTLTLSGSLGAHDPAAYVEGNTIYLGATGLGFKTSTNLTSWSNWSGGSFSRPGWMTTMVPGVSNLWAPDISHFGGAYHLYYAGSTFGSNQSCIGHATRAALDSGSWADQGATICSNVGTNDNWNAIDPNIVVDDAGTPWMAYGSFWSGLKLIKLTSAGARADTMITSIANGANSRGSLEGAWIFKRCGFYYLFSSWGACCNGAYDYNMRVGRSATVTGPYVDKAGTSLMAGGGTLLVQGNASWGAPGHNSVIVYNNRTYNIYHALQGGRGAATLRIAEILWDSDGWPISGGP